MIRANRIIPGAEYEGIRCHIPCRLGPSKVFLQIDIGFGDIVAPGPCRVEFPAMLDFPPPGMDGYTRESTIAEKFQSMVPMGILNSRMKDFYNLWYLSRTFDFSGEVPAEAMQKTFAARRTLPASTDRSMISANCTCGWRHWPSFIFRNKSVMENSHWFGPLFWYMKFLRIHLFAEKCRIRIMEPLAEVYVTATEDIYHKAEEILIHYGVREEDSLHISAAVTGKADCFITTDDKLIRNCRNLGIIKVLDPLDFIKLEEGNVL